MIIQTLTLGQLAENCYILKAREGSPAVVIDPGDDADMLARTLGDGPVAGVLVTHAHFDHILGLPALAGAPVYVHALDAAAMTDDALNCADMMGHVTRVPADHTLQDGDVLTLGEMEFTVLHTPGHTPGSVCFLCGDHLFTGDTLFVGGYGRTDLPGGDWDQLRASLKRIMGLHALHIHPGHGEEGYLP